MDAELSTLLAERRSDWNLRIRTMATDWRIRALPGVWTGFLTLLVAGPWLLPGYIFGTDFAGPRHFAFPDSPASYAGLQLALALTGLALSGEVVGKMLILASLFAAGLLAYRAIPAGGFVPRAVGSLVYMVNPFVYDRLAYGQVGVLAGYAVLPWIASSIRGLLLEPTAKRALAAAAAFVVVGILDVHMALIAVILAASLVLGNLLTRARDLRYLAQLGRTLVLTGIVALGASAYWIVPLVLGVGTEAHTLARIGEGDLSAFSTASDPGLGLLPNVLGLYGFWGETTERFASMKEFVPMWPLVLGALLLLSTVGAVAAWRRADSLHLESARSWVLGLIVAGMVAAVLEIGVSDPHIAPLVGWLDSVFPPYRGMRDAGKWAAVLALVYSQLIPIGVMETVGWTRAGLKDGLHRKYAEPLLIALILTLPLYYGNGLLYGMHGQIQPSSYPAGWYTADRTLVADSRPGRTVFLPWHGYLVLSFVRNANNVVASPAPLFFSVPVVASQDLEIPGISPPNDPDEVTVSHLVTAGAQGNWAQELAARDFKYVLLAREADWTNYVYLDSQLGLLRVGDFGSIVLYRNLLWH